MIITNILITILFYLILMYLSINLLGFLVRGLFYDPEINRLKQEGHEFIKNEIKKSERADKIINVIALILIVTFFYFLFHFWNIGVVAVAVIIMIGRLPDLIWEIKHGVKINPKMMDKNVLYYMSAFLPWIGLPLLYYFIYIF